MKNAIKYCCAIMILVMVSLNTTNVDAKTYNVNYAKTISLYEGKTIQLKLNILASRNRDSGAVETYIPDTETAFDWLNYHS